METAERDVEQLKILITQLDSTREDLVLSHSRRASFLVSEKKLWILVELYFYDSTLGRWVALERYGFLFIFVPTIVLQKTFYLSSIAVTM